MATYDTIETTRDAAVGAGLFPALLNTAREVPRRYREHRTIVALSRLDARLLRDMGFDPAAIYQAVDGTWDGVLQERFVGR